MANCGEQEEGETPDELKKKKKKHTKLSLEIKQNNRT